MKTIRKTKLVAITIAAILAIILFFPKAAHAAEADAPIMDKESMQMVQLINAERESLGLSTLEVDPVLNTYAMLRASEITKVFSHTRPNGTKYDSIDEDRIWGEMLAHGFKTSENTYNAFKNDPPHYIIYTVPQFNKIGVAHVGDYYTVLFSLPTE